MDRNPAVMTCGLESPPSSLAQVVILTAIPPVATGPNQTALTRKAAQPDLPRPYWTAEQKMGSHLLNSGKSDAACRRILAMADCAKCVSEPLYCTLNQRRAGQFVRFLAENSSALVASRCQLLPVAAT
jgi:hypothetical protein